MTCSNSSIAFSRSRTGSPRITSNTWANISTAIASFMPSQLLLLLLALTALCGCQNPFYHLVPYHVPIESNPPGARIEINHDTIGTAPFTATILGGHNGCWPDNNRVYIMKAYPLTDAGGRVQTKTFYSGAFPGDPKDHIPKHIVFDMDVAPIPSSSKPNVDLDLHLKTRSP